MRAKAHITAVAQPRLPHQKRALETVQAIVEAAGLLLVERGFAATTTNAIAARAGVSIGSLYQYFANKDEVYRALTRRHFDLIDPLLEDLNSALAKPRSNIAAEIGKFVDALVRIHEPERELIRAIDEQLGWLEAREVTAESEHQQWVMRVAQLLFNRYPQLPDPLASAHVLVATVGLVSRWLAHSAPTSIRRQSLIDALIRMIRGLLRP
jgi:AcrR family transcriptional regulator